MKFVAESLRASDPPFDRKLRITVLAGGPSAERAVSLDTGRAVADALRHRGHEVYVADIAPNDLSALDRPADIVFPALHGTFGEDGTLQRILEDRHVPFVGSGRKHQQDKQRSGRPACRVSHRTSPAVSPGGGEAGRSLSSTRISRYRTVLRLTAVSVFPGGT